MKIDIDGSAHTGNYRCQCECGTAWFGQGEGIGAVNWSPALPVAESLVHMEMAHPQTSLDIRWTGRMRDWMISYWERASLRLAARGAQNALERAQR